MRFVLVIAAAALLSVFDDCGNLNAPPPPPPKPPMPSKPLCSTDPPTGCAVVCTDVGLPPVPICCNDVGAGDRAMQFLAAVQTWEDQQEADAEAAGDVFTFCPESAIGKGVTPCTLGIPAIENPTNQDHAVCMTPPPACTVGGC